MDSVTDIGRKIFNDAIQFKINLHGSSPKVAFKFSVGDNFYVIDLDENTLKDPKGIESAWIQLFQYFEKDLDAGIEANKERIIKPETSLIL